MPKVAIGRPARPLCLRSRAAFLARARLEVMEQIRTAVKLKKEIRAADNPIDRRVLEIELDELEYLSRDNMNVLGATIERHNRLAHAFGETDLKV